MKPFRLWAWKASLREGPHGRGWDSSFEDRTVSPQPHSRHDSWDSCRQQQNRTRSTLPFSLPEDWSVREQQREGLRRLRPSPRVATPGSETKATRLGWPCWMVIFHTSYLVPDLHQWIWGLL